MDNSGILYFAHNNEKVDYMRMAIISARMAKLNLRLPIALATDQWTLKWCEQSKIDTYLDVFDKIIEVDPPSGEFRYYSSVGQTAEFKNTNRKNAYEISPYDKTLLLDVDYLCQSSELLKSFEVGNDLMINKKMKNLAHENSKGSDKRFNDTSIDLYWATVVYFDKQSEYAKILFDLIEHIHKNPTFYQLSYGYRNRFFRNDHAFSIAVHILNGFFDHDYNIVQSHPNDTLLFSMERDEIIKIERNALTMLCHINTRDCPTFVTKLKGIDVHCMNKYTLTDNFEKFMEVYE